MAKSQEKLKSTATKLPQAPGVYFFRGAKGQILYIGKATSLRNRVQSYFAKDLAEKRSPLIEKMMLEARSVSFEKTDSVLEALLLESSLIKKHTPPYNTADKDQKSFNHVVITEEEFPRVLVMREREISPPNPLLQQEGKQKLKEKFGPFPHGAELKEALKIIRKIFPFRDKCVPVSPKDRRGMSREQLSDRDWRESEGIFQQKNTPVAREMFPEGRPCFNYQIGLCPGVCVGKVSKKEYKKTIKHIKTFFSGNKKKLIKDLEKEMKVLTKKKEFEKATEIKRKIFALKHIQDIALIKKNQEPRTSYLVPRDSIFRIEAYDIAHISGTNMVGVMTVVEDGEPNKSEYRKFNIKGQRLPGSDKLNFVDDVRALQEVLTRRLTHSEWPFPNLIVVDGGVAQLNAAQAVIKEKGFDIQIVSVVKDERHKAKEIRSTSNEVRVLAERYKNQILLANSESHRFALGFHRKLREKLG